MGAGVRTAWDEGVFSGGAEVMHMFIGYPLCMMSIHEIYQVYFQNEFLVS